MATIHKLRSSAMTPDDILKACMGLGFTSVAVIGYAPDGEPKMFSDMTMGEAVYAAQCLIHQSMHEEPAIEFTPDAS